MRAPVLVVFSGTQLDPDLFGRALTLARETGAPLVLLDVRHRQQAERLGEYLESGSPLGRATVKALQQSVKQQRSQAIQHALRSLLDDARGAGVEVAVREEKGAFGDVVARTTAELGASTVVLAQDSPALDVEIGVPLLRI